MHDTPDLSDLAKRHLRQLVEAGLPRPVKRSGDTVRLRLRDDSEVHLQLGPEDWQYDYRGARRDPVSERMELAILAALVALEASPVDPGRKAGKGSAVTEQGARLRVGMQEAMKSGADELEAMQQVVENDPALEDAGTGASQAEARLSFAEAVLKHYRPDFDNLSERERILLLTHAGRHVDDVLRAIDALHEFAQAGGATGRARKKAPDPQQDVRAAELADTLGLTHRTIGKNLDIPLSDSDVIKGEHRAVADMIRRGRALFVSNLGEDGYRRHLETIGPDLERWHSLDDRERLLQRLTEIGAKLKARPLGEIEAMRPEFEQLVEERFPEE